MRAAFLQDAPRLQREIRQALHAQDLAQVALYAHSMKGNAGYFAATALQDICKEIEQLADAGDSSAVALRLPQFEQALQQLLLQLQAAPE